MDRNTSERITISYFGTMNRGTRLTYRKLYVRVGPLVVSMHSSPEDTPLNTASRILIALLAYLDFIKFVSSSRGRCILSVFSKIRQPKHYVKKYMSMDIEETSNILIRRMEEVRQHFIPCRLQLKYSPDCRIIANSLAACNALFIDWYIGYLRKKMDEVITKYPELLQSTITPDLSDMK